MIWKNLAALLISAFLPNPRDPLEKESNANCCLMPRNLGKQRVKNFKERGAQPRARENEIESRSGCRGNSRFVMSRHGSEPDRQPAPAIDRPKLSRSLALFPL